MTVNSWFDLVAKEGLTTFMEQAFAADLDTAEAAAMGLIKPPPPFKAPSCTAAVNATAAAAATASEAAAPRGFLPLQQLLPVLRGVAACRGGKGTCGAGVTDIEAAPYAWRRIADVAYLRRNQVRMQAGTCTVTSARPADSRATCNSSQGCMVARCITCVAWLQQR